MLQHDLAGLIGIEHPQVVELAGDGVVAAPPDLELDMADGALGDAVHLQNFEGGLDDVGQLNGAGLVFLQLDDVHGIVQHVVRGRRHLSDFIRAGPDAVLALQHDEPVLVGLAAVREAPVDLLDQEGGAGDRLAGLPIQFQEPDAGAGTVDEIHHDVLVLLAVDPDGFAVVGVQQIGLRHVQFLDLIAPAGHGLQHRFAVRTCHHIVFITDVDASDVEAGVGDGVARLRVPLLNGEGALVVVDLGDRDGLLPLEILGVDMDAHGRFVAVETSGGGYLHELVMALHHIAHRDGAVRLGLLSADDLAVPEDQKNSSREGAAALIHLLQLYFYLAGIFKNQGHIMLPVPHKGLLDLGHVGAEDETLRRGDLLRQKRPGGELGEVQILLQNVAAVFCDKLTEVTAAIVQLDGGDADDRAGDAHGGVIGVNFSN